MNALLHKLFRSPRASLVRSCARRFAVLALAACVFSACEMPDDEDQIDEPVVPTVPEPQVSPVRDSFAPLPPARVVMQPLGRIDTNV